MSSARPRFVLVHRDAPAEPVRILGRPVESAVRSVVFQRLWDLLQWDAAELARRGFLIAERPPR